tara:strand:- start:83 stop:649 length:567 start_codon:yes stop_codon:yes gene_type:complete
MCGRFTLRNKGQVQDLTGEVIEENYNIAPSSNILTITDSHKWRKWSYSPSWAKEPMSLINARSETVREKPSFKESKPCLVLADGWYEWKRDGEIKQPYFFHLDHQMFYIAGIYNESGCVLLTKEANQKLSPIHHRMPIILKHNEARDYLNGKDRFGSSLSMRIEFYPVDRMVNSPRVNNEKNIEECRI